MTQAPRSGGRLTPRPTPVCGDVRTWRAADQHGRTISPPDTQEHDPPAQVHRHAASTPHPAHTSGQSNTSSRDHALELGDLSRVAGDLQRDPVFRPKKCWIAVGTSFGGNGRAKR